MVESGPHGIIREKQGLDYSRLKNRKAEEESTLVGKSAARSRSLQGMKFQYNHDLNVSEEFLGNFPKIHHALKDRRLIEAFESYNEKAALHKKWFERLGLISLILGVPSLEAAALQLTLGGIPEGIPEGLRRLWSAAEAGGLIAALLMIWERVRRHRFQWCLAVFCRERLRQWHFQKFLDGKLISLLATNPIAYDQELDKRWIYLQESLRDGPGMMNEFKSNSENDFFYTSSAYADSGVVNDVFESLKTLRIEHQLGFSNRKLESEADGYGLALQERTSWSETVASSTLAGAVLISALSVVLSIAHRGWFAPNNLSCSALDFGRILGGCALMLAVLSAASRAYRAGCTLPDESESYDEYCDRIRDVRLVFKNIPDTEKRLQQLERLEEEAASELRRFLRMKSRATFIF
jgi:hypothetical protein